MILFYKIEGYVSQKLRTWNFWIKYKAIVVANGATIPTHWCAGPKPQGSILRLGGVI